MAIAFRGSASGTAIDGANTTVDMTGITGLAEGDFCVAAYVTGGADSNLNAFMVTQGWTPLSPDLFSDDVFDTNFAVFGRFMGATPDTSVEFTGTSTATLSGAAVVMAFSGVDRTRPLDVAPTTATGIDSILADPPSITLSGAAGVWTVVVGGGEGNPNSGTFTGPTNYTTDFLSVIGLDNNDSVVGIGYNSSPSATENPGAFGFSGTDSTSYSWGAVTLALRPSNPSGITCIGAVSGSAVNGGDITLTLPTLLENDIVIVAHGIPRGSDLDVGMTTTGYTEVADLFSNDNSDINLGVFYKVMGATPDTTAVTAGQADAGDGNSAVALCFRNVDPTTPMDVAATTATGVNSSNPNPPAIDYDDTNAVIVAVGATGHATNVQGLILPLRYFGVSAVGSDTRDSSTAIGFSTGFNIADPETPGDFQMCAVTTGTAPYDNVAHAWAAVTMALRKAAADGGSQFILIVAGV